MPRHSSDIAGRPRRAGRWAAALVAVACLAAPAAAQSPSSKAPEGLKRQLVAEAEEGARKLHVIVPDPTPAPSSVPTTEAPSGVPTTYPTGVPTSTPTTPTSTTPKSCLS